MTKHKLFGMVFPLFLLFSLFFPLIKSSTVYAAPLEKDKSTAWNAAQALEECLDDGDIGIYDNRTSGELNNGALFQNVNLLGGSLGFVISPAIETNVYPGYLVDSTDGEVSCTTDSEIKILFGKMGVNNIAEWLVDVGVYKINGGGEYVPTDGTDENKANKIKDRVSKDFNFSFSSKMPKSMQYTALLETWKKRCQGSKNSNEPIVKFVKSDGSIDEQKYSLKNTSDLFSVGYNLDNDGSNDNKMKCDTIRDQLNATAADYAKIVKENPEEASSVDADNKAKGEDQATCESNNNDNLDWLLCGMISGIDNMITGGTKGTGGIAGIVDELLDIEPSKYNNPGLKQAWSYMKNIATLALVVIALIMIIGQAVSKE